MFAVLVAQTGTSDSLQPSRGPASSSTTWLSVRKFTSFTGNQPSQIFPCQPFIAGDFPKYSVIASGITVARTPESKIFICFQNNASFFPLLFPWLIHSLLRWSHSFTKNSSERVGLLSFPLSLLCTTCYCWQTLHEWCNLVQTLHHHSDARHCVGSCCLLQRV